jgi:citrate synthase
MYPRTTLDVLRELPAHDVRDAVRGVRSIRSGEGVDLLLILHADHEQNCSTITVRVVGSSRANLFASVAAGIRALWGPLHGGANQEVIEMLDASSRRRRTSAVRGPAKDKNANSA